MKNTERKIAHGEQDAEKIAAIRKIRKLMEFWRIAPQELRGKPVAMAAPQRVAEIRYRHPVTGEVWDGQGPQPQWLRHALLKEGYTVDELRRAVHAEQASQPPCNDESSTDHTHASPPVETGMVASVGLF